MVDIPAWQNHLDPLLVQRLWQPVAQPGAMDGRMVEGLFDRYYQFLPPAPLLQQCWQRQTRVTQTNPEAVPIVYAQPRLKGEKAIGGIDGTSLHKTDVASGSAPLVPALGASPIQSSGQPTLIQAKLDPASPTAPPLGNHTAVSNLSSIAPQPSGRSPIIQAKSDSPMDASVASQPLPLSPAFVPLVPDLGISPIQSSSQPTLSQAKLDPASPTAQPLASPLETHTAASNLSSTAPQPSGRSPIILAKSDSLMDASVASQPLPLSPRPVSQRASGLSPQPPIASSLPVVRPTLAQSTLRPPTQSKPVTPLSSAQSTMEEHLPRVVTIPPQRRSVLKTPALTITPSIASPVVQPLRPSAVPTAASSKAGSAIPLPLAQGIAASHVGGAEPKATRDTTPPSNEFAPLSAASPKAVVSGQPVDERSQRPIPNPPVLDIAQIADQVERRLRRNLVVERERRGWSS